MMRKISFQDEKAKSSVQQQIRRIVIPVFVSAVLSMLLVVLLLLFHTSQYTRILHNVTTVSAFNQDFKDSVDQKMYYYVIESRYSEGLPMGEVLAAKELAGELLQTTTDRESSRAITSALSLCGNLEEKILQIEATANYDDRQTQLENNIYVLTNLIQQYMYTYMYHEAALLSALHLKINRQIIAELAAFSVLMLAMLWLLIRRSMQLSRAIVEPIGRLCRRVEEISSGDLSPHPPEESIVYEICALEEGVEQMVCRLNRQIERTREEQEHLRSTELALLQAQINPHFLYNTLDTIVWLIEADKSSEAENMVENLSDFFRSFLSKGNDIIPLSVEERHIRSYLEIQQVRYRDILCYEIDIDPEISGYEIPKLTLQPLIENALYHGIKCRRGKGHIWVNGFRQDAQVLLTVRDDGAGIPAQQLEALRRSMELGGEQRVGFGLTTVHERLRLLFGPEAGLQIESEPGHGTVVTAYLPWKPPKQ